MSSLETRKIEPITGTTVTLGAAGDAVTMPAGVTVKTNTVKDAGGNTLWTSNGSGTLSSVNSALTGGMILISSQTASTSSSIEFTTGIDSTYEEYVFLCVNIQGTYNGARLRFQCNASGQTGYNENITSTFFDAENSEAAGDNTVGYKTGNDQANGTAAQDLTREIGGAADESGSGILQLFAPSNTTFIKHFYSRFSSYYHADYVMDNYVAGYINTTGAITQVQFTMETENISTGTFYLYGIK